MQHIIDIQSATKAPLPFSDTTLQLWANAALAHETEPCELTLRFVTLEEITQLNNTYRSQNKATNVLAFQSNLPDMVVLQEKFLGDVIICPDVLAQEVTRSISLEAHWAHIVIHGILHLLGYNHIKEDEAQQMQALEIQQIAKLGFANPYHEETTCD